MLPSMSMGHRQGILGADLSKAITPGGMSPWSPAPPGRFSLGFGVCLHPKKSPAHPKTTVTPLLKLVQDQQLPAPHTESWDETGPGSRGGDPKPGLSPRVAQQYMVMPQLFPQHSGTLEQKEAGQGVPVMVQKQQLPHRGAAGPVGKSEWDQALKCPHPQPQLPSVSRPHSTSTAPLASPQGHGLASPLSVPAAGIPLSPGNPWLFPAHPSPPTSH